MKRTTAIEHHMNAVKRMAIGVLNQAVEDLDFDPTPEEQNEHIAMIRAEARLWFVSDLTEPGSFLWVCGVLKRDPATVRRKLAARSPPARVPLEGEAKWPST